MLGPGKDQGIVQLGLAQQFLQQCSLVALFNLIHRMGDSLNQSFVVDLDFYRIIEDILDQMANLSGHCGGKNQRLTLDRHMFEYFTDIREKSLVEHMISLIEDQHLYMTQINGPIL